MNYHLVTLVLYTIGGSLATFTNKMNSTTISSTVKNTTTTMTKIKKLAKYTNENKLSGTQYMSEVGSRCTDDGFFADRDDCRKFHVCYGGTQSVRWCKNGMLWDETKIGCSLQSSTSCIGGRKKWGQEEDTTTTTTTASTMIGTDSKLGKGNYTCRSGATGFFADPSSCSIYHWCVIGVLQSTHRCNAGLHFSASANGCLWPKDAECEGQIAPPYSPIECATGSSGYFPDPYDCSVFHYCDGAKSQSDSLLCSSGLIWSSRMESCAWPHEVTECQNSCPANYSSQMRFADPVICSQYVQCVDGHLEQRTCPNNLLFDRITKTCKPYEQAECHGAKPDSSTGTTTTTISPYSTPDIMSNNGGVIKKQRSTRFSCISDGYYGDAQDCRIYHVCIDGRDYRSMCAPGLAWESLLRLCMPAHLTGCQSSKSFEPPSGSSKKKWFPFTRSVLKTTTTTTTTSTQAVPFGLPSIFTCAGRSNGYYADPVHCHKFHYCATGWHSVMECDNGLAYSAQDNDCVPAELADCGNNRLMRKKY
ncbi:unnamed protein product [Adineta steineri]|uniref:Chitin-binding type-2 domain-containing protein n=1 Tax=Adineta steineri TaxID=433720 RepID=A0A814ZU84_9BILA|nr:unnamed protein product [Adineta steineri]CAF1229610.1 unnamed protein product [Adineta steineri]CAF1247662.1 unnamed protein product [Adineta steineri]CAF1587717.1 unnamed protein product [Adineta steineri]